MNLKKRVEKLEKRVSSEKQAKRVMAVSLEGEIVEIRLLKEPAKSELGEGITEQGKRVKVAPELSIVGFHKINSGEKKVPPDTVFLRREKGNILEILKGGRDESKKKS